MNLRALLAIPIAVSLVACSPPPEPEASSREEAMKICHTELDAKMEEIEKERQLVKENPKILEYNNPLDSDIEWSFLHSNEYETVLFIQAYCKPSRNKKFKGFWYVTGYLEYLTIPTDKSFVKDETEVNKVALSYATNWKED